MQLLLTLNGAKWSARFPQSGSQTGWSEWRTIDRQQALYYIERGFSFETN